MAVSSTIQALPGQFCLDVIGGFPGPELPVGLTPVAFLVIRCSKRDVPFSLELTDDLTVECLLVGFDAQEQVGPRADSKSSVGHFSWLPQRHRM